jgi:hypothetical protein
MRFFFTGPRMMGIQPGISFGAEDFRRSSRPRQGDSSSRMTGSFVYVVKGAGNHHKIGVSTDPIARIASLQTGSHEPLDFSYIGVTPGTGFEIERAAHDLLKNYRQSGEWFSVPASIAIGAVLEASQRLGEPIQQVSAQIVPQIIHLANQPDSTARPRLPGIIRWPLMIAGILFGGVFGLVIALVLYGATTP